MVPNKKVATPLPMSALTPLFRIIPPLSSKIFGTPQVTQFLAGPIPFLFILLWCSYGIISYKSNLIKQKIVGLICKRIPESR